MRTGELPLMERILSRIEIDPDTGCWLWTGAKSLGYGHIRVKGKTLLVHRVVYEEMVGPIPEGLDLDHVKAWGCMSRACCNYDHLEPVTRGMNVLRGDTIVARQAALVKCPKCGGQYYLDAFGARRCRPCERLRQRQRRASRVTA